MVRLLVTAMALALMLVAPLLAAVPPADATGKAVELAAVAGTARPLVPSPSEP